jgi:hypothetical protein
VFIPSPAKNSNLPPNAVEFTVDDSSENCIKAFCILAFVIPAVPLKFVFVRPVIVFVLAANDLFVNVFVGAGGNGPKTHSQIRQNCPLVFHHDRAFLPWHSF